MKPSSTLPEYKTPNLEIASGIHAAGQPLLRLDWDGQKAFFVFADKSHVELVVQAYWSDDLKLSAKELFIAMRELKDRLFEAQREMQSIDRRPGREPEASLVIPRASARRIT